MKCKRCNGDCQGNRWICPDCLKKFSDRRSMAHDITVSELGTHGPHNTDAFKKRFKQIERQLQEDENKQYGM